MTTQSPTDEIQRRPAEGLEEGALDAEYFDSAIRPDEVEPDELYEPVLKSWDDVRRLARRTRTLNLAMLAAVPLNLLLIGYAALCFMGDAAALGFADLFGGVAFSLILPAVMVALYVQMVPALGVACALDKRFVWPWGAAALLLFPLGPIVMFLLSRQAADELDYVGQPMGFFGPLPPEQAPADWLPPVDETNTHVTVRHQSPLADAGAPPMIEAVGLSKFYGEFAAARDVSFKVYRGEVVAFLGPNGAGKSTTMKMLTGYLAASAGVARIAGFDMSQDRIEGSTHLGYLPENGPLYHDMTPRSLLEFFAETRGIALKPARERIRYLIDLCDLGAVVGKPIGKLSKGYRQRVGMAQVLLHEPEVLIMDEPTSGLDPNQIHEVRETITRLGQTHTILLSTHILQEVEAMCSRILFIDEGRLKFDGPIKEFTAGSRIDQRFHELSLGSVGV